MCCVQTLPAPLLLLSGFQVPSLCFQVVWSMAGADPRLKGGGREEQGYFSPSLSVSSGLLCGCSSHLKVPPSMVLDEAGEPLLWSELYLLPLSLQSQPCLGQNWPLGVHFTMPWVVPPLFQSKEPLPMLHFLCLRDLEWFLLSREDPDSTISVKKTITSCLRTQNRHTIFQDKNS